MVIQTTTLCKGMARDVFTGEGNMPNWNETLMKDTNTGKALTVFFRSVGWLRFHHILVFFFISQLIHTKGYHQNSNGQDWSGDHVRKQFSNSDFLQWTSKFHLSTYWNLMDIFTSFSSDVFYYRPGFFSFVIRFTESIAVIYFFCSVDSRSADSSVVTEIVMNKGIICEPRIVLPAYIFFL